MTSLKSSLERMRLISPFEPCCILYMARSEVAADCLAAGSSASIWPMRCSLASIFAWASSTRCWASS